MSGGPRASRLARWARHGHTQARVYPAGSASPAGIRGELHDGRCPSRSGRGEALFMSNRDERRREAKAAWPLTRETSAGSLRNSGLSRASAVIRCHEATHSIWHPDEIRPLAGWGAVSAAPRSRWTGVVFQRRSRMRAPSRAGGGRGAGWPIEAQTVRSVVLADCVDCRSRRAAPGLSPNGDESSLSQAEGRTGVGSRIAMAKS